MVLGLLGYWVVVSRNCHEVRTSSHSSVLYRSHVQAFEAYLLSRC